jgi:hypothetical protein
MHIQAKNFTLFVKSMVTFHRQGAFIRALERVMRHVERWPAKPTGTNPTGPIAGQAGTTAPAVVKTPPATNNQGGSEVIREDLD